ATLAFHHVPTMIVLSGPGAAATVVNRFPAEYRERSAELLFVRGLIGWVQWDFLEMRELFRRAEEAFAAAGRVDDALLARAYRATIEIGVGRTDAGARLLDSIPEAGLRRDVNIVLLNARNWQHIDRLRLVEVAPTLARMLDLLDEEGRVDLIYHTPTPLRIAGLPGTARLLLRHAEMMLRAGGEAPTPLRPLGLIVQAWCALWRGDVAGAIGLRE